jgi:iron-sulfur cluster assembly accessory protein
MLRITSAAAEAIKKFLIEEKPDLVSKGGLRIAIEGGGCSGMQYALSFDAPKADDKVFEESEARVIIDPTSLEFVDDSTIDYAQALSSTGFRIHNPKAKQTCGCGTSFEA